MIGNPGTPGQYGVVFNVAGTGHTGQSAHDHVFADLVVVADLHQIIYFTARADYGAAQCTPVYTGVGADFNIVVNNHIADLGHFYMPVISEFVAEAVGADNRSRMDDDIIPQNHIVVDYSVGINPAIFPNGYIFTQVSAGQQGTAIAYAGVFAYHCVRADIDVIAQRYIIVKHGLSRNLRTISPGGMQ